MNPPLPTPIRSILFVCMGNICRSPAGENVMRRLLQDAGLGESIRCDSAGLIDYHVGEPPDARMRSAGQRRGLPMTGAARQVTPSDLDAFDLVLAMDDDNFRGLMTLADENNRHKVLRFCSLCTRHPDREVPDPYYGGLAGFDYVLDLMEDGCQALLAQVAGATWPDR